MLEFLYPHCFVQLGLSKSLLLIIQGVFFHWASPKMLRVPQLGLPKKVKVPGLGLPIIQYFIKCQTGPPLKSTIKRRLETPPWPSLANIYGGLPPTLQHLERAAEHFFDQLNNNHRRQILVALSKAGGCDPVMWSSKFKK